jgi:hypothetical protein
MKPALETIKKALDIYEASEPAATRPGDRERARDIAEARRVVEALGQLDWLLIQNVLTAYQLVKSGRSLDEHVGDQLDKIRRITGSEESDND